jgi:hypothetical protein
VTRKQSIEALRTKLAAPLSDLPLLSEGAEYMMELSASETLVPALLRRIVDDAPLGRGFSFQLPTRRVFVYERDIRPGPDGSVIVTADF